MKILGLDVLGGGLWDSVKWLLFKLGIGGAVTALPAPIAAINDGIPWYFAMIAYGVLAVLIALFLFLLLLIIDKVVRNLPKGRADFWESRDEMNNSGRNLSSDIENSDEIWLSNISGAHLDTINEKLLFKVRRVVLNHPDAKLMENYKTMFGDRAKIFPAQIRQVTEKCESKGIEIRWSDDPVLNVVLSNPDSMNAWARVQWQMPYILGPGNPNHVISKRKYPTLYKTIYGSFEKSFLNGKKPSSN